MVVIPEPIAMACVQCGARVHSLRYVKDGLVATGPCGHTAGFRMVPVSTLEPDEAA